MEAAAVVRSFLERMEARDWVGATALMAPDASISYSATGERFTGSSFMAMNEAYPEGWRLEPVDVVAAGERVAVQVRVPNGDQVDWLSGFYTVVDGRIVEGHEHWVTERSEPAPEWRAPYTVT
ncbi:MAG: nuclear transport factor 2 family protein [Actinomycetota bacterium]|nr:nuclear transport factor 2 family protein [Actinomycetota bacterium]